MVGACRSSTEHAAPPANVDGSSSSTCHELDPNSQRVVDRAASSATWIEVTLALAIHDPGFDFSRFAETGAQTTALIEERKAQLAPLYEPIVARLTALEARDIETTWLTASLFATLHARDVRDVSCWPEIVSLAEDALACSETCTSPCATQPAESCGACPSLRGDRIDRTRGCRVADVPVACGVTSTRALLTCYVRESSGEVLTSGDPFLVERGTADLRPCTRAEGGEADPRTLPLCP